MKNERSSRSKLRLFLEQAKSSALVRRVGLLGAGVAAGQVITLATSPLLTRLYTPQTLGLFGLFTSLSFLVGNVSSLRYDLGIVLAKGRTMAAALWSLSFLCVLLVAAAVALALWGGGAPILSQIMGASELAQILPWVPFQVVSIGIFLGASQWATRKKQYKPQAQYQFTRALLVASLQILAGYLSLGPHGLVAAQIIGFFGAAILLLNTSIRPDWKLIIDGFSLARVQAAARRYRRLPQFTAPQELITALTQNLPYFILGSFFGPGVVGFYWLTIRTMQLPINFMSQAVRQVLLQHTSSLKNARRKIFPNTAKMTGALICLGAFVFLPVIFWGPFLFALFFGSDWSEAGKYSQWVALWMLTVLAKIPAWCVFHVLGKQKLQLIFEVFMFASQLAALIFFSLLSKPLFAIAGYTSVCTAFNIIIIATAFNLAWKEDRTLKCVLPSF